MSISVTVSGQESTSVVSVQPLSNTISVSGISKEISVIRPSENSATVTVSTGDPITVTSNFSNFITGSVVRPNQISGFITNSDLSDLNTATGNLNTRVNALEDSSQADQYVSKAEAFTKNFGPFFNELTYTDGSLTKIETYTNSNKTTKTFTKTLTYTSGNLTAVSILDEVASTTIVKNLTYDNSGNLVNVYQ